MLAGSGLPRAEARALLAQSLDRRREWLIAHGDETLPEAISQAFRSQCERRQAGEPMAYLLGRREFYSRDFEVSPAVLIPRPETEMLAKWAIDNAPADAALLDLGTGSGALAITIALERPDLTVSATDISAAALAIARRNASSLHAPVDFFQGHWWGAITDDRAQWSIIISNPPYIARGDRHLEQGDLRFEPELALESGPDGLDAIRQILAGAPTRLKAGGKIMFEHGFDQAEQVTSLLQKHGFHTIRTHLDDQGLPRLTGGQTHTAQNVV